jgi:hypothetical protein
VDDEPVALATVNAQHVKLPAVRRRLGLREPASGHLSRATAAMID